MVHTQAARAAAARNLSAAALDVVAQHVTLHHLRRNNARLDAVPGGVGTWGALGGASKSLRSSLPVREATASAAAQVEAALREAREVIDVFHANGIDPRDPVVIDRYKRAATQRGYTLAGYRAHKTVRTRVGVLDLKMSPTHEALVVVLTSSAQRWKGISLQVDISREYTMDRVTIFHGGHGRYMADADRAMLANMRAVAWPAIRRVFGLGGAAQAEFEQEVRYATGEERPSHSYYSNSD